MAHFAKIENGVVQQVIVVSNDDCASPGWTYDAQLDEFVAPPTPIEPDNEQ